MQAPTKAAAVADIERFAAEFQEKYPKAVDTLIKDQEQLLTYFDYPAAHWVHLRTTNAVESPFSTVKQRLKQTRGAGSREAGLAMVFKLLLQAQEKWRKLNSAYLLPAVHMGMQFPDGETKVLDDMPPQSQSNKLLEDVAL